MLGSAALAAAAARVLDGLFERQLRAFHERRGIELRAQRVERRKGVGLAKARLGAERLCGTDQAARAREPARLADDDREHLQRARQDDQEPDVEEASEPAALASASLGFRLRAR